MNNLGYLPTDEQSKYNYRRTDMVELARLGKDDMTLKPPSYYERFGPGPYRLPDLLDEPAVAPKPGKVAALDNRLTRALKYLLDKQIHFIVLALAVVYLCYSWYSVQSKYVKTQGYNFEGVIKLATGKTNLNFYRDAGTNRPLLTTSQGEPLLEISDWASSITINGATRSLWDTWHTYDMDNKTNKLYHAMTRDTWTLFQEVSAGPEPNRVLIEYYFRSSQKTGEVSLQLGHFDYHFIAPTIGNLGFETYLSGGKVAEEEQDRNVRYHLALRVNLGAYPDGVAPVKLSEGARNRLGLTSINTRYTFSSLPANERVLLASEEITWNEVAAPARPAQTSNQG